MCWRAQMGGTFGPGGRLLPRVRFYRGYTSTGDINDGPAEDSSAGPSFMGGVIILPGAQPGYLAPGLGGADVATGSVLHGGAHAASIDIGREHADARLTAADGGLRRVRRVALGAAPAFDAAGVRVVLACSHRLIDLVLGLVGVVGYIGKGLEQTDISISCFGSRSLVIVTRLQGLCIGGLGARAARPLPSRPHGLAPNRRRAPSQLPAGCYPRRASRPRSQSGAVQCTDREHNSLTMDRGAILVARE